MTGRPRPFTPEEFTRLLDDVEHTAYRLEVQRTYRVTAEQASFTAFLRGEPSDPDDIPGMAQWFASVRNLIARGGRVERVRVQENPPTDYQRWERWFDEVANAPAGELIRYMTRTQAYRASLFPDAETVDWWLMDDRRLIEMHFDRDGARIRTEVTTDHSAIVRAGWLWSVATAHSKPLPFSSR